LYLFEFVTVETMTNPCNTQRQVSPVKLLFQVIQCLHHVANVTNQTNGNPSKAFKHKVQELNHFIRPALPNQAIKSKINQVNNDWSTQVAQTLKTHYVAQLEYLKNAFKLYQISANDWVSHKNQALNWARRAIGKKLAKQTLQNFDQLFTSLLDQAPPSIQNPNKPSVNKAKDKVATVSSSQTDQQVRIVHGPKDKLSNFWLFHFMFHNVFFRSAEHAYQYHKALFFGDTELAEYIRQASTAKMAKYRAAPLPKYRRSWQNFSSGLMFDILMAKFSLPFYKDQLKATAGQRLTHPVGDTHWGTDRQGFGNDTFSKLLMEVRARLCQSTSTNNVSRSFQAPQPSSPVPSTSRGNRAHTTPPSPVSSPLQVPTQSPVPATAKSPKTIVSVSDTPAGPASKFGPPSSQGPKQRLMFSPTITRSVSKSRCVPSSPPVSSSPQAGPTYAQVTGGHTPTQTPPSPISSTRSPINIPSPPSSPNSVHPISTGTNKIRYDNFRRGAPWKLPRLSQNTVIIGDSNLDRITDLSTNHVEIHCFPGMSIHQANKLVESYEHGPTSANPAPQPREVIISVGINDRCNAGPTIRTCTNKLFLNCRKQFPHSRICMAQVNSDHRLPSLQGEIITKVNSAIKAYFGQDHAIPLLPSSRFHTAEAERHPYIHWTEPCANDILQHWLQHLN
jgi:ribA/ribD-fused uncharacterized protein